jgi:hypothetical protein
MAARVGTLGAFRSSACRLALRRMSANRRNFQEGEPIRYVAHEILGHIATQLVGYDHQLWKLTNRQADGFTDEEYAELAEVKEQLDLLRQRMSRITAGIRGG